MTEDGVKNATRDTVAVELAGVQVTHHEGASDRAVAREVNWRIEFGDFWVVAGRPSSGRSSLLLTAAGLNRPAGGTLRILGCDAAEAGEKDRIGWRQRIGFVFEYGGRLFSHLTVAQNIALPLQYHGEMDEEKVAERVDEVLTMTALQDYAHSMPSRLSLGVQQRVGLARALALSVEVLFLDSSLTTLAVREERWWLDFLRQLQQTHRANGKPLTVVASADDFRGWLAVGNHFAILEDGRFGVVGGREQVEAAAELAVREFLGSEL